MSINIAVRFTDNVKDLRKNLQEGLDQIEATKASVERLVKSLAGDNLVIAAHKYAAAVKEIGGVERLNASEKERINNLVTKAIEKYELFGKVAPQALHDLANATKQAAEPTENLSVSFTKLVGSFVTAQAIIGAAKGAFNAITGELSASVTAANEAEKATVQLVAALKAQGTATPSVVTAIQGYAAALQKTTIYQDDALEGAAALLVTVGNVMPLDMEKALKAVTDLASGRGVDLHTATLQVAKAAEGNTSALKKAGIQIDETKAKAEGFGYVLDEIEKKFGGQAAAIAGTYQGRLTQLGNTWNNVEESIGRVITQNATVLKAFDLINQTIDAQTGELKENQTVTNLVSDAVIIAAKSFGILAQAIDAVQTFMSGFIITLRDGGAALGNIALAIAKVGQASALLHGDKFTYDKATAAVNALSGAVKDLGDRNASTTARSAALGTTLQTIGAKADALAKELDATRGKTIALTTATDKDTGAWDKHTTAITNNSATLKKSAEDHARLIQKVRELEVIMPGLRQSVGELDTTELKSIETHLKNVAAAEKLDAELKKLHDTIRAIERSDFAFDIRGLENVGTKIPILSEAQKKTIDAMKATVSWRQALDSVAHSLTQLAQVSGDKFGGMIQEVAQLIVVWNAASKAADDYRAATTKAGKAAALTQGAVALAAATDPTQHSTGGAIAGGALSGALTGAAIGSVVPVLGTAAGFVIGGVVGGIIGYIRSRTEWSKLGKDIGREFGVNLSKETLKAWEAESKYFGRQATTLLHLNEIIDAAGGVASFGFDKATKNAHDLFSMIETGQLTVKQAGDAFDKVFSQLADTVGPNGLVSKGFIELIKLNDRFGTKSAAVAKFVSEQVSQIATGLSSFAASSSKVVSQGAASALGSSLTVAFAEMLKAGTPILDIFKQLDPVIEQLQKKFEAAGFTGGEAFNTIRDMAAFAKDEVAGPVLQGIIGLGQALAGLHNIGALDQDTFAGLTEQINDMYSQLEKQGKGGPAALRLLQAPLQTVWQLVHDFGYEVDENTKRLLAEAEANGIVGAKMKPINEQMLDATNKIADAVEYLAEAFGYLPEAAGDAADGISDNLKKIKLPKITIPISYDVADLPEGTIPYIPGNQTPIPFSGGSGGFRDFGPGTLATLHGREAVVTEDEWRDLTSRPTSTAPTGFLAGDDGSVRPQPVPLILQVDGRQLGQIMFDPETLSGNVRERARLQVQQMVREQR